MKTSPKQSRFIYNAYVNVIKKISELYNPNDIITDEKIDKLDITQYMKDKIKGVIKQTIPKSDEKKIKKMTLHTNLTNVMGIGKTKADLLIKMGLTDIKQLKLNKWKKHLSADTLLLLKYKPMRHIPYDTIKQIKPKLIGFNGAKIVGSYLRGKPFSKDIDIMLVVPTKGNKKSIIEKYISYLCNEFPKVHIYAQGSDKASFLVKVKKIYVKVDVFATLKKHKYGMLLYATGSKQHNIKMRSIARKNGYLLNQYGLFKNGVLVDVKSERDIFTILKIPYIPPKNR
jgi:DNA polymerase/3'-5' exonuclease PolX